MKNVLKNKLSLLVLSLIIAIPSIWAIIQPGFFTFNDETQVANLFEINKTINLGQFPPRWAPDFHFTYGSPYPGFNYQLPYYFGYIFHQLGFNLVSTYQLLLAVSLILGAIGMYVLSSSITTPLYALAAATLYTYTPYRAVDVYVRGTIGESFAFALFPWIFWALYRLYQKPNLFNSVVSSLFISALVLSHQPSTVLVLPFIFLVFGLLPLITRNFRSLPFLILSGVTSLFLTAYYLFPVLFESKLITPVSQFNFSDHFPFIKQLIYSPWGYGSSVWGPEDMISFQVGLLNWAIISIGFFALILWGNRKDHSRYFLLSSLILFAVGVFLMNIRSSFFWSRFPFTNSIQFPWRLLTLTTLSSSIAFIFLSRHRLFSNRNWIAIIVTLLALALNISYFRVGDKVDYTDDYYLRRYLPQQVLLPGETVSTPYLDYTEVYYPLPLGATRPSVVPQAKLTANLTDTKISVAQDNPFNFQADIESAKDDTLTYHVFYYPGWSVTIDGRPVNVASTDIGAVSFPIQYGKHQVKIVYEDTPIRKFSNYLSVLALVIIGAYLTRELVTKKHA